VGSVEVFEGGSHSILSSFSRLKVFSIGGEGSFSPLERTCIMPDFCTGAPPSSVLGSITFRELPCARRGRKRDLLTGFVSSPQTTDGGAERPPGRECALVDGGGGGSRSVGP